MRRTDERAPEQTELPSRSPGSAPSSPFLAIAIAMILSPVLSLLLRNRNLYVAREPTVPADERSAVQVECTVCHEEYEMPDVALCPFHAGAICSLCCTLESACKDVCKTAGPGSEMNGVALPMAGVVGGRAWRLTGVAGGRSSPAARERR